MRSVFSSNVPGIDFKDSKYAQSEFTNCWADMKATWQCPGLKLAGFTGFCLTVQLKLESIIDTAESSSK